MAVGNAVAINALFRFKSNLDSGIPQAIQIAAIEALRSPDDEVKKNSIIIQKRRDKILPVLQDMGLHIIPPKASFYIWARVPQGYTSASFTTELLDKVNIAVTPGASYGSTGEGYVRLSLTVPDERFDEGIRRLKKWCTS
jgi:LL-diaminopimelate aminotransferase